MDGIVQLKQIGTGGVTDMYITFHAQNPDDVIKYY
jgi:alpha-glucosidase (family GH31 glycosyl hydrolase)